MSPNGLHAPPALAATIIFTKAGTMNFPFPLLTASATVDISRALVRLSARGESKNVMSPVAQKSFLKPNPFCKSHARNTLKTFLSSIVLI